MAGASYHRGELCGSSTKQAALAGSVRHEACRVENTDTGTKACPGRPGDWASSARPSPEKQSHDLEQEKARPGHPGDITWVVSKPARETEKP